MTTVPITDTPFPPLPAAATRRTPTWAEEYRRKIVGAAEALQVVQSGARVYIHPGCAEPESLVEALVARKDQLENVEIVHLLTMGTAPYVTPDMAGHFRHRSLFTGANVRQAVNEGRADYTPIFLSEIPRLFTDGTLPLDVALIQVSPPDEHGFCSFGVGIECTKTAAESARVVIAEMNRQTPRTLGDSFIHLHKLDYIVPVDRPMLELPRLRMSPLHSQIGAHVASLVENGSTLQMGIGGIPDAVLFHLAGKKDLGIHTEMFSDGVIELVQKGVINNEKKTLHRGKIIASFVLGSRALYDFIDNNPICEFHPSNYVNDPFVIAENDRMVAINSALQVDLTGQVCADSIGDYIYSGFGGQVDFIRGAARSQGGKPIIALPSTARNDELSRIVASLDSGAGVVTSRGDVHYVVTEFGVANLHGRSIRERAAALIAIAHPKFRDELTAQAKARKIL
ncbi:MAG: acetyl-CoA hydrolase/transferase family protein [candidate division Zixibacteria bacterium]|nr:acetyl-CoA hydrolase/transferase family protein [candidate division Zixibacteria bacterium]